MPLRRRKNQTASSQELLSSSRLKQLSQLQKTLGIHFQDITLLNQACTHRSYTNESKIYADDNERLEFLGDSVLGLITAEYLYTRFSQLPEGVLAKWKSKLVSGPVLSNICKELNLVECLQFGKGEQESGKTNKRVMENLMEALLGAIYLDSGFESCQKFILPHLKNTINSIEGMDSVQDYKSLLQEKSQKSFKQVPDYRLVSQEGPDHDKVFVIRVTLPNGKAATGEGKNKRSAEQYAAKKMLSDWSKK